MRKSIKKILCLTLLLSIISCSKEKDNLTENGIQTVLKGHVSDEIRGINIGGYKIVLVKSRPYCANWACGMALEEVAVVYTDNNGDFFITFNYKLNPGELYTLYEQYYGYQYYPEYSGPTQIIAGAVNTVNINAWKPVQLKLNVEVLNNINTDLRLRVEFNGNKTLNATEYFYEQNVTKTYTLRTKPNSNVNIIFWYYTGAVLHQKTIPFQTTLAEVTTLNLTIDCSTF